MNALAITSSLVIGSREALLLRLLTVEKSFMFTSLHLSLISVSVLNGGPLDLYMQGACPKQSTETPTGHVSLFFSRRPFAQILALVGFLGD